MDKNERLTGPLYRDMICMQRGGRKWKKNRKLHIMVHGC